MYKQLCIEKFILGCSSDLFATFSTLGKGCLVKMANPRKSVCMRALPIKIILPKEFKWFLR